MPAGLVDQEDGAGRDDLGDLGEVQVHRFGYSVLF
jgi:hypothetical protein